MTSMTLTYKEDEVLHDSTLVITLLSNKRSELRKYSFDVKEENGRLRGKD